MYVWLSFLPTIPCLVPHTHHTHNHPYQRLSSSHANAHKYAPAEPCQTPQLSRYKIQSRGLPFASHSPMAASMSGLGSSLMGGWGNSVLGEDHARLAMSVPAPSQARAAKPIRSQPMMKNVNEGKGVFAPVVVITRDIIGKKRFNQLRGKAIALHSQVITEFCKSIGADGKQRQGLIRLAKKNGERLGFLA